MAKASVATYVAELGGIVLLLLLNLGGVHVEGEHGLFIYTSNGGW